MGCKASKAKNEMSHVDKEIEIVQKIKDKIKDRTMDAVENLFKIPVNTSISNLPSFKLVKQAIEDKDKELKEMREQHQTAMDVVIKKLENLDSTVIRKIENNEIPQ